MEYVYAALLLNAADKEINEDGITQILESAGVEVDDARVKALVASLEDVNIEEAIEKASIPASTPTSSETSETEEVEEEEEEEEDEEAEEEEEEEEDEEEMDGLGAMFG